MDVSDLRKSAKLKIDNQPWIVVDFQFVKPGKGQGLYKCKIKNMLTRAVIDRTWRSGERLEAADVLSTKMQYLYVANDMYVFMDTDTYEQIEVHADTVGDNKDYLLDNLSVDVLLFEGRAVDVSLPSHLVMEITECEPGVKGNSSGNVTKDAIVQTGLKIQVPLFVTIGDHVKIDTRTGSYVERVRK